MSIPPSTARCQYLKIQTQHLSALDIRPNPIGLQRAEVIEIQKPGSIRVRALDGTPIVDIKPVMPESEEG